MREKFPVFDLHCDTAVELSLQKKQLAANDLQLDLARADRLLTHHQFYAFCCVYDQGGLPLPQPLAEARFYTAVSDFYSQLSGSAERVRLCRNVEDLIDGARVQKQGVFLSLEGPEVIDCDPDRLEELKELGFLMTTLTWNFPNALAGPHGTDQGLTDRGRAFVRRAQELGILIDVSHLSEKAFWDLVDITSAPIVASHSNSRAACDHTRNLTDKQFKVICNLGGLVGLNLYAPFLNASGRADFSDVKRHLDHFLELGGQHHLALGGDLDGCDKLPTGFTGIDSYNDLGRWLMQQGMEELTVNNIFNNNAVRFAMQHLQRKRVGG
ncbi:MAG: membrane dipeptidase [Oscillospiraceae bacterium]|nr:membrane dipeptidase [Oscillospiraceae bacterium]